MSKPKTPDRIYLIDMGAEGLVWCDDPAPGTDMDADDAVEYVRIGAAQQDAPTDDMRVLYIAGTICQHLDTALDQSRVMAAARDIARYAPAQDAEREDAERYRLLRRKVCIAGNQFHILNLAPTYVAPDAAVELDAVVDAARAQRAAAQETLR